MPDFFRTRVPLAEDDAAYFRDVANQAEQTANIPFQSEMDRLRVIAAAKRAAERGAGPVDQEASLRFASKFAEDQGFTGGTPQMATGLKNLAWLSEEPESRNVFFQAALVPEQALMNAAEALSGEKTLADRAARLGMAVPAAFFPELGYPVQQSYDRMYESNPVAGLLMDFVGMPDVGSTAAALRGATRAMRYGGGVPTHLIDKNGNVIRQLRNSPMVRR